MVTEWGKEFDLDDVQEGEMAMVEGLPSLDDDDEGGLGVMVESAGAPAVEGWEGMEGSDMEEGESEEEEEEGEDDMDEGEPVVAVAAGYVRVYFVCIPFCVCVCVCVSCVFHLAHITPTQTHPNPPNPTQTHTEHPTHLSAPSYTQRMANMTPTQLVQLENGPASFPQRTGPCKNTWLRKIKGGGKHKEGGGKRREMRRRMKSMTLRNLQRMTMRMRN